MNERNKKNESKEIKVLTEMYYNEIYAYCLRRTNRRDDSYDITQSVFLAFIAEYHGIDPTKIRMWLYATAKHKLADYFDNLSRFREKFTPLESEEDGSEPFYSPFDEPGEDEIDEIKKTVISYLDDGEKELYADRFTENLDYGALAQKYCVPEATMRKRISRLKMKIMKLLGPYMTVLLFMGK